MVHLGQHLLLNEFSIASKLLPSSVIFLAGSVQNHFVSGRRRDVNLVQQNFNSRRQNPHTISAQGRKMSLYVRKPPAQA